MNKDVLIVAKMEGAANFAQAIGEQVGGAVDLAATPGEALNALRHGVYAVVVVEQSLAESDPAWADQMWERAGTAMPLQINFAFSSAARLTREVKAALARREGDQTLARQAAAAEIESELRSPVTGLLLESELALLDPAVSGTLEPKLRHLVELAGSIRERLRCASQQVA